jgi:hypothetical protein
MDLPKRERAVRIETDTAVISEAIPWQSEKVFYAEVPDQAVEIVGAESQHAGCFHIAATCLLEGSQH